MKIKIPPVSLSMEEIKVLQWFVSHGDSVRGGDKLVEVETDKAVVEIDSPGDGVVHILAPENVVIAADASLGEILPQGVRMASSRSGSPSKPRLSAIAKVNRAQGHRAGCSPAARKLAREYQIDLSRICGSGPGGRIISSDILNLIEKND